MPQEELLSDIHSLKAFLEGEGYETHLQKETNQIYVVFKLYNQEFPLFFRIYDTEDLLQLLVFFPLQVRKERFDPLCRMLHLLNKEIDIPGFGFDESLGLVFHRIMIPVFDKKLDKRLLKGYLRAIEPICTQFLPAISGTVTSDLSFEEIVKKSEARKRK